MLRTVTKGSLCALAILVGLSIINLRTLRVLSQNGPVRYSDTIQAALPPGVLKAPTGLAVIPYSTQDPPTVWVADTGNNVLRQYGGSGILNLTVGTGTRGHVDGSPTAAEFDGPIGVQGSYFGGYNYNTKLYFHFFRIYVNDAKNNVVREFCDGVEFDGRQTCDAVSTVAGTGTAGFTNGPSLQATFSMPSGIPSQAGGLNPPSQFTNLILDTRNHAVRQWDHSNVTTFAGNGTPGFVNGSRTSAEFNSPTKATWDSSGNIYIADLGNAVIRKIDSSGNVTTFAGTGKVGGTDGPATSATFASPTSVASYNGYIYVADALNNKIRRIDANGNVTTYAGTGRGGLTNGTLSQATFSAPTDLAIYNGIMYITDTNNNAIRIINMTTGEVATYAQ